MCGVRRPILPNQSMQAREFTRIGCDEDALPAECLRGDEQVVGPDRRSRSLQPCTLRTGNLGIFVVEREDIEGRAVEERVQPLRVPALLLTIADTIPEFKCHDRGHGDGCGQPTRP